VIVARKRVFSVIYIESDHDMLMIIFYVRMNRFSKLNHTEIKFDIENPKLEYLHPFPSWMTNISLTNVFNKIVQPAKS